MVDLSIVIVNWNTRDLLRSCLKSIYAETKGPSFEIFVIDNASQDGSAEMIEQQFPKVHLIRNTDNVGFARANNQAIARCKGRYILLLNPDTIVLDKALVKMVQFLDSHPTIGALGCKILRENGKIDPRCARHFPTLLGDLFEQTKLSAKFSKSKLFGGYLMTYWDHNSDREVDVLSGACMMIRKEVIERVGPMDEDFFMYGDDIEWCYRIKRAGWKIFYYSKAAIIHIGDQSSKAVIARMGIEKLKSRCKFYRKHYGTLYAWAYKSLLLLITIAKQLVFWTKLLLSDKKEEKRHQYQKKIASNGRVLKWILAGWPQDRGEVP